MQLLKEVKTYRCEDEDQAKKSLETIKETCGGEVTKSVIALKTKKSKGEVIDSWAQLDITIAYTQE